MRCRARTVVTEVSFPPLLNVFKNAILSRRIDQVLTRKLETERDAGFFSQTVQNLRYFVFAANFEQFVVPTRYCNVFPNQPRQKLKFELYE